VVVHNARPCHHGAVPTFQNPFRKTDETLGGGQTSPSDVDGDLGELVEDEQSEWLAYDLHDWALESRAMLAQLLLADEVVHSWQGATLLAHDSVEAAVDALIDEVKEAENAELDPDRAQLAFEMDGWSADLQSQLVQRLAAAGVPHGFDDDGDLVVHEEDEDNVESVIEDLLARLGDDDREELDGLQLNDLLSAMFGAADRLRRDPFDGPALTAARAEGNRIAGIATPYGFAAAHWSGIRDQCLELVALIDGEGYDQDDLVTLAGRLRDGLHQVI